MRNKIGICCMIGGAMLVLGALSLLIYNHWEATKAQNTTLELMPKIITQIEKEKQDREGIQNNTVTTTEEVPEIEIDGYGYMGYLSIPVLSLELPIMSEWDYARLKIAPCRYFGTVETNDLVVIAHNYAYHFGRLKELAEGDQITFTDAMGNVTLYEVVLRDVLDPAAVDEVTAGAYDLTLITCTYGGQSRVTVYCNQVQNKAQD